MCLIIDASLASRIFDDAPEDDFIPVIDWLRSETGMIVYGGKNGAELSKVAKAARYIRQLAAAGHAYNVPAAQVDEEESKVVSMATLRSNDAHVIALARVSNARVLCTEDEALIQDFKDLEFVPRPKGKIYKRKDHADLLGHSRGCVGSYLAQRRRREARNR